MAETPEITQLLNAASANEANARERLLDAVYDQLHKIAAAKMANEADSHTLQPTALINEAYPRLVGNVQLQWQDRAHFLGAAAEAMRRVLIDHARRKNRIKRGGDLKRQELLDIPELTPENPDELLALNEALTAFEQLDDVRANVVKLKFFCGLTNSEAAEALQLSVRSVERHWTFAKAWLQHEIAKQ